MRKIIDMKIVSRNEINDFNMVCSQTISQKFEPIEELKIIEKNGGIYYCQKFIKYENTRKKTI